MAVVLKPIDLKRIDKKAMTQAIEEYDKYGRAKFLKKYGFSRSSKFYFQYNERLYDVKALVGAAYRHATGVKLANDRFSGGPQSNAVFRRIGIDTIFKDEFGELTNLSGEFDHLSSAQSDDVRKLGFSEWIQFQSYKKLHTTWLPGVYVIADCASEPKKMKITDPAVVYIGETVEQNLAKRLYQLDCSLHGRSGSSGGTTLKKKGYKPQGLSLSVRSFPLGRGNEREARSLRSSQIRLLERRLLHEYVIANGAYPAGNSK